MSDQSNEQNNELSSIQPPPPTITSLIEVHALQVLLFTGQQPNPQTGQREINLPFAKYNIEMLELLKEKTQGNLDEEESDLLDKYIEMAKQAFIHAAKAVEEHEEGQGGDDPSSGPEGEGGGGSKIIMPGQS